MFSSRSGLIFICLLLLFPFAKLHSSSTVSHISLVCVSVCLLCSTFGYTANVVFLYSKCFFRISWCVNVIDIHWTRAACGNVKSFTKTSSDSEVVLIHRRCTWHSSTGASCKVKDHKASSSTPNFSSWIHVHPFRWISPNATRQRSK